MRVLALDASSGPCSAALAAGGHVLAVHGCADQRGAPGLLPGLVAAVLADAPGGFDAVAVGVGPGSFTGLRAAIAMAHGLALGAGVPVVGVTAAEALAAMLPDSGRPLWVVTDTKRGRLFLARDGAIEAVAADRLPLPAGPVALAGDAAELAAAWLTGQGADAIVTQATLANAAGVALAGERRAAGALAPLAAQPMYVEPPEARPASRSRPAPV